MFCNQCEQTAKGTGCTIRGVCGKLDIVAGAQDALVQSLRPRFSNPGRLTRRRTICSWPDFSQR